MFVFCDVPDYGCHGWLRETWVCPDSYQSHLTAMFALTHLVLLAQSIAVLGVVGDDTAKFSVTKRLPAHCWREDVYFVCLIVCRSCMKQLPAPSKKGRLTDIDRVLLYKMVAGKGQFELCSWRGGSSTKWPRFFLQFLYKHKCTCLIVFGWTLQSGCGFQGLRQLTGTTIL